MDKALHWGVIPVFRTIMITNLAKSIEESFLEATLDGVAIVSERIPEPFPELLGVPLHIHIVLGWPGIRADIHETGLHEHLPKGSSYFAGSIASSNAEHRLGTDTLSAEAIVSLLSALPNSVSNAWPSWLEQRMRRRYKPSWLDKFRSR